MIANAELEIPQHPLPLAASESAEDDAESASFDPTFGLGIADRAPSACRDSHLHGRSHSHAPHGVRGRAAPLRPTGHANQSRPAATARLLEYERRVVGATTDPLEPLSYLAGMLALLGNQVDLAQVFAPRGSGLAVTNRITIVPVPASKVPLELRDALAELEGRDTWLITRNRPYGLPGLTLLDGALLREQARIAGFITPRPCSLL